MRRLTRLGIVMFGIPLLFAGWFFVQMAEIWDAGGAFDEDTRAATALPAAWLLVLALLLVAACAASALWPWGFA